MALTATAVTHTTTTTCALPRRQRHHAAAAPRRRAPPRRSLLASPPRPPTRTPKQPPAPLDRLLSDLASNPRLLTPSLLVPLLSALPLHPSPRRRLTALRRLLPASLLRRYPDIALRLLHVHASLGLVAYAHRIFDHYIPDQARRDGAFPWNCLIAGYVRLGRHHDALALYLQMGEEGVPRDRFTFLCALQACAGVPSLALGQAVHRDAVGAGLAADVSVCDALLDMYARCGSIEMAREVFDAMPERDSLSWNVMLVGSLRHGLSPPAMELWQRMLQEGHEPDSVTLSTMLSLPSLHSDNNGKHGLEVHAWVIRHELQTELSVANALIGMYSRKNQLGKALSVFKSMTVRDLVSWNAIISAHRQDFGILMMFRRMVDSGMQPDDTTFAIVLAACDDLGLVEGGMRVFSEMENKYRLQPTVEHYTSVVNMLGKAGMVNEACQFVAKLSCLKSEPTVLRALLDACSVHGNIRIREIIAKRLFDTEPDNVHSVATSDEALSEHGWSRGGEEEDEF